MFDKSQMLLLTIIELYSPKISSETLNIYCIKYLLMNKTNKLYWITSILLNLFVNIRCKYENTFVFIHCWLIKFLPAARYEHAGLHVHFVLLPSFLPHKRLKEAFRGQKSTGTWVIEVTDFRIEVRSDLRGHSQPQRSFSEKQL